jgi:hypothetical protein
MGKRRTEKQRAANTAQKAKGFFSFFGGAPSRGSTSVDAARFGLFARGEARGEGSFSRVEDGAGEARGVAEVMSS